ncbi:MAG: hypothetical protein ACK4IY_06820, partial [Chitinophagales bacterium]
EKLRSALQQYINLVLLHLEAEEPVVEEAVSKIPVDEVLAIEKKYMQAVPVEEKEHTMPWMLDAMDKKDQKIFMGMIPLVGRLVYRLKLKRQYNRLTGGI